MSEQEKNDVVEKTRFSNGLKVVTEQVGTVRSVAAGIWIRTGSRNEPDEKAGITHFLEHMLFKGTETRSAYDIALAMESVGGYLNAFTSNEYTCYYTRSLDTRLERALDVLGDMILNSTFPEEELEKEKKVVIEEMKMYRDSPEDYLFESFNSSLFRDHALGRPIIGFEETVNGLNRDDLFDYVRERYRPWNMLVSVAGSVDHDKVTDLVRSTFDDGNRRDGAMSRQGEPLPSDLAPHREVITRPIEQTHMIIGRRGLHFDHQDKYLLLLANTVLGGGMSSRLHQNVREKYGYCYSIGTFNQSYTDAGIFGIYTGTDRGYVDHVRDLVMAELDRLRQQKVPAKELEEAKSQLKGKLLLSQENMSNRMTRLAKSELYFDRFVSLDELVEKIDEVSPEQIRLFSERFFDRDRFSETLLLPEKK